MKTFKFLVPVFFFFAFYVTTSASILIVDNHVPTPAGTYATIKAAHDAANAGDTLMLVPSETEYTGISITKTIHIIGNGWDRPATDLSYTKTGGFSINAIGASIEGVRINGDCNPNSNNITVKRNLIYGRIIVSTEGVYGISILQNMIIGGGNSGSPNTVQFANNCSAILSNNFIYNNSFATVYSTGFPGTYIIKNNIFRITSNHHSISLGTSGNSFCTHTVLNNIVISGIVYGVSSAQNNIGSGTQFVLTGGNLQNIDMSTVFVDMANNDFHLKAGSPAIGAGDNGTDCGIYGGELGFVDKGVPGLPYIYYLQVPSIANKKDGLNVTVKAKTGNGLIDSFQKSACSC